MNGYCATCIWIPDNDEKWAASLGLIRQTALDKNCKLHSRYDVPVTKEGFFAIRLIVYAPSREILTEYVESAKAKTIFSEWGLSECDDDLFKDKGLEESPGNLL